jgi:hypothetical protein
LLPVVLLGTLGEVEGVKGTVSGLGAFTLGEIGFAGAALGVKEEKNGGQTYKGAHCLRSPLPSAMAREIRYNTVFVVWWAWCGA